MGFFFNIQTPPLGVLCAMKFAAILSRQKGRNYYDIIFLLSKTTPDMDFLAARTGIHSLEELKSAVANRMKEVDMNLKKRDFAHLLFNERNTERILSFSDLIFNL